jgi:hypothetical protein
MKLWADWLADNPRDHARCPGLTETLKSGGDATLTALGGSSARVALHAREFGTGCGTAWLGNIRCR